MPIKTIDLSQSPGSLVQICAACGIEHTIRFDRGAVETKPGPFALSPGATLELSVDGKPPAGLSFANADANALATTTPAELKAKLAGVSGLLVTVSAASTVLIESATTGLNSVVKFTGGSALTALGRDWDVTDPCPGRPVLGAGDPTRGNKDLIALRRCGCGSFDMIHRTWDVAPPSLAGTPFYEHRRAVNMLAEHFKAQGWVHPDLAAKLQAEKDAPPDRFPGGTKVIAVPIETRG